MAENKQNSTEEKKKNWTLIREIVQFVATILTIAISTFTLWDKIGSGNDQIKQTRQDVTDIRQQIQDIKEHLIARGIIVPKD